MGLPPLYFDFKPKKKPPLMCRIFGHNLKLKKRKKNTSTYECKRCGEVVCYTMFNLGTVTIKK